MQNPIEYAPMLSKLARDEAQRQATLTVLADAVKAGLASDRTLEVLTGQMNADRATAFLTLMRGLVDFTGSGQVPVSVTVDVYSDRTGSVTSAPLLQMYNPMTDRHPSVDGLAIAAPDGVYDEATLRIHATVEGDHDFEGLDAIYANGQVEVQAGQIARWTLEEFNSGVDSYARPANLPEWTWEMATRLFPVI